MDSSESRNPDRLHLSLSSAWASFLGAQHCSREVSSLRKSLDGHIHQTSLAIAALQQEAADRHGLLSTAVAESKSTLEQHGEQHAAELTEIGNLQTSLSTLQQEIIRDKEHVAAKVAELSKEVAEHHERLESSLSTVRQIMSTVQDQSRAALGQIELLQQELKRSREDKVALEQRLAVLETRIETLCAPRPALSEDAASFLDKMLYRQDDLMRLLDAHEHQTAAHQSPPPLPNDQTGFASKIAAQVSQQQPVKADLPVRVDKRKLDKPSLPVVKRGTAPGDPSVELRSLYLAFRERYKTSPPTSDTEFIWEFIGSIKNPGMSEYIQESLAGLLPEYVTRSRDTRRKNPQRHVTISKGLTWRKFREALVRVPWPL